MTEKETKLLMASLRAAYPKFYAGSTAADLQAALKVWHGGLEDLNWNMVQAAFSRLICTSKWPPTIADMREAVDTVAAEEYNKMRSARAMQRLQSGAAARALAEETE